MMCVSNGINWDNDSRIGGGVEKKWKIARIRWWAYKHIYDVCPLYKHKSNLTENSYGKKPLSLFLSIYLYVVCVSHFFPPVHLTAASFVNYKIYAIFEQQNVNIDLRICWNAFDLFY